MRVEYKPDVGFGRNLYVTLGKLHFTWTSYEGNWYVALMWA